jgi:hypothetical protein
MMILREKKISLRKPLFLLATISAFAFSTAIGYCADERLEPPAYVAPHLVGDLSPKQKTLIQAVRNGDLSTVRLLINREKIDKNTQEPEESNSLLHLAIQGQKKDIFDFFLKINCDVDIKNDYGETPLHEVASLGDKAMLDRLLEEETARVNTQDKDGNTAFHMAILKKNLECVSSFMGVKGFDYTLKNKKGSTIVDLFDRQIQGARGQAAHAQDLKTALLCDFNVTVQGILQKEAPVTPSVQKLVASFIQQNRKLFLSYCWKRAYNTKPMVDDFEKFISGLGITNYYRDVREEEGLGMTLGTHIENFMKNAKDADVTLIFLNDAYLHSRNCMYEFLQVWDADAKKIAPNALVIRHPDFHGLFGGPNASVPYTNYWGEVYKKLRAENVAAADRKQHLEEMDFVTKVEANMASIIHELSSHIQVEYQQLRSKGFEDVFKLALARGGGHMLPAQAAEDEGKESPAVLKQREDERLRQQETEEKDPAEKGPEMPLVARGHEATYLRFLNGVLIYTPARGNKVTLPIAKLVDPLEGVFDLSQCGDADKYLRIATGYRREVKNDAKVEIWFTPRFLVEKELNASANYLKPIFGNWKESNSVGIFWSWSDEALKDYEYLTQTMDEISNDSLYKKWESTRSWWQVRAGVCMQGDLASSFFRFIL